RKPRNATQTLRQERRCRIAKTSLETPLDPSKLEPAQFCPVPPLLRDGLAQAFLETAGHGEAEVAPRKDHAREATGPNWTQLDPTGPQLDPTGPNWTPTGPQLDPNWTPTEPTHDQVSPHDPASKSGPLEAIQRVARESRHVNRLRVWVAPPNESLDAARKCRTTRSNPARVSQRQVFSAITERVCASATTTSTVSIPHPSTTTYMPPMYIKEGRTWQRGINFGRLSITALSSQSIYTIAFVITPMADSWVPNLVLITGATGHLGFRTLIHALSAGYPVRAAVRSQAKANTILSHPHIQFLNPGSRLTFTIVPDLAAPCAYDEAVQDVSYIIHIASPLMAGRDVAQSQRGAYFIRPAVRGTIGMLEAARKSGTVRRVVITSSIVAIVPASRLNGLEHSDRVALPTDRVPFVPGPYKTEFAAYAASKVAALQEAEAWMARERPEFEVVYLHPSFVEGRNDLAMNTREAMKGTNAIVLGIVLGQKLGSNASASVHNEDVARVHVQALNPEIPGNTSYILNQKARWEDVKSIVQREFPDAVQKRLLPNNGSAETHEVTIDASLTEDTFGFTHLGFEEQVKSVVGHYLELRKRGLRTRGHEESAKPIESHRLQVSVNT
ncbi:hypothetical protein FGG08_002559, partial [Glutinoglossum americanum]